MNWRVRPSWQDLGILVLVVYSFCAILCPIFFSCAKIIIALIALGDVITSTPNIFIELMQTLNGIIMYEFPIILLIAVLLLTISVPLLTCRMIQYCKLRFHNVISIMALASCLLYVAANLLFVYLVFLHNIFVLASRCLFACECMPITQHNYNYHIKSPHFTSCCITCMNYPWRWHHFH